MKKKNWEKIASILRGGHASKPSASRWLKTFIYGSAVVIGLSVAIVVWQNKDKVAQKTVAQTPKSNQIDPENKRNDAANFGEKNSELEKEKSGSERQITPIITEPQQISTVKELINVEKLKL
ncbi:MAG: hypothetical protein HC817_04015 [Saprospiraceae bacterium]|nr:hypothetical protein [Saprospiraceae bacterium]